MGGRVVGKVALITGAASGIGKATAEKLSAEGAIIILSDINVAAGIKAANMLTNNGADAVFIEHDTSDESSWDKVISETLARYGKLDVLFNNAGVGGFNISPIDEMTLATWRKTMAVNLDGVFLGLQAGIRAMKKNPYNNGSIINTSSIYGLVGAIGVAAYNASKGGVRTLTKAAALECAQEQTGIRVNSIHPGHIETPMIAARTATAEQRAQLVAKYPIGHLGDPVDIANAVLFLASDEAKFVTGTELVVDGGFTAQ